MSSEHITETMSGVDAAWLHMEEPTNLMMVAGILHFSTRINRQDLVDVVIQRILQYPRFHQRVVDDSSLRAPHWEDVETLDMDYHLQDLTLPAPGDKATLQQAVGELLSQPLDFEHPLWQAHLIDTGNGDSVLMMRIHHCIADGIALISVLMKITGDSPEASLATTKSEPTKLHEEHGVLDNLYRQATGVLTTASKTVEMIAHESVETIKHPERLMDWFRLGTESVSKTADILFQSSDPETIFKGPLGVTKKVAWSNPIPLDDIKAIRVETNSTVNDVLISILAGSLRRYLQTHNQSTDDLTIRTLVPVNLRPPQDTVHLGNHFGLVFLELPLGIADPVERIQDVKAHMDAIKSSPEAYVALGMLKVLGHTPAEIQRFVLDKLSTKATAVMTNVPGPQQPIYCVGQELKSIMFWVPMSARLGLGVSILSYNGTVRLGVNCDAGLIPDPDAIIDGFAEEFQATLAVFQKPAQKD